MKVLVVLSAVLACALSQYYPGFGYHHHPYAYSAPYAYSPYVHSPYAYSAPVVAPVAAPVHHVSTSSQYHAQDELGQFTFGHAGDNQARVESKSFDGTVTGAYSYVDPTGKPVHVNYLADHNGFRVVGANNLPEVPAVPELKGPEPVQDTPEVVAAKADFAKAFAEAKAASASAEVVSRRRRGAVFYSSPVFPVAPVVAKSTVKFHQYEPVDAKTPADTKKIELKEKETEVLTHVPTPLVYQAAPAVSAYHVATHPLAYSAPHYYGHSFVGHPFAYAL